MKRKLSGVLFAVLIGCLILLSISCSDPNDEYSTPTPDLSTPTPEPLALEIIITPASMTMPAGSKTVLTATVTPPSANQEISWTLTPGSAAGNVSIDSASGLVTANTAGLASVRAFLQADPAIYRDYPIVVESNELLNDLPVSGDTAILQEAWYYFSGAVGCLYDITWLDEGAAGFGSDIIVSAYHADKETPYFENSNTGTEQIELSLNEPVFIKVSRNGATGSFQLNVDINNSQIPDTWTFLLYFNCWELENSVINNLKEVVASYNVDKGINIVILLDKYQTWSNDVFTETFTDTRLYTLTSSGLLRISGYPELSHITLSSAWEANMADPQTLADFISFGKNHYPAQNTALIIQAHGFGPGGLSGDDAGDDTDRLHPGEMSEVLGPEHSVELLGFNGCQMGNIEFLYQFRNDGSDTRFTADYILASPATTQIIGWRYDWLFDRISSTIAGDTFDTGQTETITGATELIYKPSYMESEHLAKIIIEEQRDSMFNISEAYGLLETLSCYDMTMVEAVKEAVDALVISLTTDPSDPLNTNYAATFRSAMEAIRDNTDNTNYYFVDIDSKWEKTYFPLYELSDICRGIEADNSFSTSIQSYALALRNAINAMIIYSYYGNDTTHENGLSIFFSIGDDIFAYNPMYTFQWWYNATGRSNPLWPASSDGMYEGNLDWCKDKYNNQDRTGFVDNWFELLDAWYDPEGNGSDGGVNWYQY